VAAGFHLSISGRIWVSTEGEIGVDPDFVPLRHLQMRATDAGFAFEKKTGTAGAYLARLKPSLPITASA
jgi:hypothetical protein